MRNANKLVYYTNKLVYWNTNLLVNVGQATRQRINYSIFMSTKQFQSESTERLRISSNSWWYLLQRIVCCSHITLFSDLGIGEP